MLVTRNRTILSLCSHGTDQTVEYESLSVVLLSAHAQTATLLAELPRTMQARPCRKNLGVHTSPIKYLTVPPKTSSPILAFKFVNS